MITLPSRIWNQVQPTPDSCWFWLGPKHTHGYGLTTIDGRTRYAHRVMYENAIGPIPSGLQIDHLCEEKSCVNPEHLEAVTPYENCVRSEGTAKRGATQTHCKRGHEFTAENTYRPSTHPRRKECRTCKRNRTNAYKKRRRLADKIKAGEFGE